LNTSPEFKGIKTVVDADLLLAMLIEYQP